MAVESAAPLTETTDTPKAAATPVQPATSPNNKTTDFRKACVQNTDTYF
mgnify:CR=1 FL=1